MGAKVGAGINWQKANDTLAGTTSEFVLTLDGAVEFGGANIAAAFFY